MSAIGGLVGETISLSSTFVIAMLIAGIVAAAAGYRRNSMQLEIYDAGQIWGPWFLVMGIGIGVVVLSLGFGLLSAGVIQAIGSAMNSAFSDNQGARYFREDEGTCTSFLLSLIMTAAFSVLFGAIAGTIHHSALKKVVDWPIRQFVRANIVIWVATITGSVFLAIFLGVVTGQLGITLALLLGGAAAGTFISDRFMSAVAETIMNRRYGSQA